MQPISIVSKLVRVEIWTKILKKGYNKILNLSLF